MDGFFVCKIQKLSDKVPGETKPVEGEEAQEEEVDKKSESNVVQDAKPGKRDAKKSKKKGKKRRSADEEEKPTKKSKTEKISVPPPKQKQMKKKLNAKTSKPRRTKLAIENM